MGAPFVPPIPEGWIRTGSSQKPSKDAAGLFVAVERLGALRDGRVADRVRLCLRRLLPRLLRDRALLNADQRFAVGAVEDVYPPGATRLGYSLPRLAIDHGIKEHDRAGGIIVPNVVMHLL